jgi:NTE family protein
MQTVLREKIMTFIRKSIAFARTAIASFFEKNRHPVLSASEIDFYLFNREARMDEAWESEHARAVGRIGSDQHSRRKLGLAFGGGFARAMAHIGVLRVLEEERIPVDLVAGTSAGAILGAAYCAGMKAKEMEEMAVTARFRDFARMTLSRYGLYASDRMANFCERALGIKNFEDLKIPLAITATDVRTGDPVVFTKGPLVGPMRASCAYPGMFPPVKVDGRSLIDGMLAYSVPTTPLREMGAECVVGVYLSADRSWQPAPRHMFDVIGQCFSIAEAKMCALWKKDADLLVQPDITGFSFDCFHRAKELIANGEKATRATLPQLRRLLGFPLPAGRSTPVPRHDRINTKSRPQPEQAQVLDLCKEFLVPERPADVQKRCNK